MIRQCVLYDQDQYLLPDRNLGAHKRGSVYRLRFLDLSSVIAAAAMGAAGNSAG